MNDILATFWNDAFSVGLVLALACSVIALRRGLQRERELARTDELTGIENRRAFYELADREIRRAARYGKAFTVAYFDIDDLKLVNDRYGHEAGDAVLRLAADTARKTIRASDAVARLGGDEFAILLYETTAATSETVIRKLQMAISDMVRVNGRAMTVSLGAVTCLDTPETVDALLRSADELLYAAKRAGKNRARHLVVGSPPSRRWEGRIPLAALRIRPVGFRPTPLESETTKLP
ncbi:MAG TPA: GGDEF domain-containing protein [Candidatus Acidoferrales bacterium]|jgi:diguanylate cyclase (GGDEF)-like protein|nr:GGDEF domain-containing protein [Candidatus Dormibacteraeota bacterium]HEX2713277.1 GGDEF domain-containing protein [Candidatus Acidoferrales bacterium]